MHTYENSNPPHFFFFFFFPKPFLPGSLEILIQEEREKIIRVLRWDGGMRDGGPDH